MSRHHYNSIPDETTECFFFISRYYQHNDCNATMFERSCFMTFNFVINKLYCINHLRWCMIFVSFQCCGHSKVRCSLKTNKNKSIRYLFSFFQKTKTESERDLYRNCEIYYITVKANFKHYEMTRLKWRHFIWTVRVQSWVSLLAGITNSDNDGDDD